MYEKKTQKLASKQLFFKRLTLNIFVGIAVFACSLGLGMFGYHYFEKMEWIDAFLNASMILSGMGPVDSLKHESSKIFAGCYALFSGIIFLVVMAIVFAPIYHRMFHQFHLDDSHQ